MKTIIFLMLVFMFAGSQAHKDKYYYSHWRNKAGIQDLKTSDCIYSDKGRFYYYISNDSENIYVDLKIFSPDVQSRIVSTGLITWINMDGRKNTRTGIQYPAPLRRMNRGANDRAGDVNGRAEIPRAEPGSSQDQSLDRLRLIGFPEPGMVVFTPEDTRNFRASISMDKERYMNYELVMPLSKLAELKRKNKGDNPVAFGFTFAESGNGMQNRPPSAAAGAPSFDRGGGGGRGGGSRGGGMRGGGSAPSAANTPQIDVVQWISDIILATGK